MNVKANLKPALLSLAVLGAIGGSVALTATAVNAQSSGSTVVERVASKFNLNKDDVQAVFDEVQDERKAERQADFSEDLQDKVDDGDITAEQKTLIENKFKELQAERESQRDALEAWAEENGVDAKYLHGGHGFRGGNSDDRLQDAVDDGDITAEQKTLIENKQKELEDAHETKRDELEQWAEDNNIELSDVMPKGRGHGGGMGRM